MGGGAGGDDTLPQGTVTFLFTDIEGSTRRWEMHGAAMASCITRHEELLRKAVEPSRGRVVKTIGDGVMAVFADARDALDAALAGQAALDAEDWDPIPRLRVRMGVHTGSCQPSGHDYFGEVVNRAARIADAGHGGQILVSGATRAVLGRADHVQFVSRGAVRLKDLDAPLELHQVLADGLNNELLPLRSLEPDLTDLPTQRTTFVGRHAELERTVRAIEAHRLVTLLGPGGVGKTRLAVHAAGEVAAQFGAGVRFIDLAEVDSSGSVAGTTLDQLYRRDPTVTRSAAVEDPMDGVVRHISGAEMLLILDNCEHVNLAASVMVDGVLENCPRVRVLATSREPLKTPGEQVLHVAPLSADRDGESPAVQLFVERSIAGGGTSPSAASLPTVAEICELVDGLPLGIELAAARSLHVSLDTLRDRLADQLDILQGRDPTRPVRHRNIEGLLRWSFDLLEPGERTLLSRLAVFAGPVDLAAIEAVCVDDGVPSAQVLDRLVALVDRSLVIYDESAERYRLLNIVRAFARDQLDGSSTDRWRARHAEWCAHSLDEIARSGEDDALARFMASHGPEVAAAIAWADDDARADVAWSLAGRVWRWYEMTGRVREGLDLVQRALRTGPAAETVAWASAAAGAANLALVLGDVQYAVELQTGASRALERCGAETEVASVRVGLAIALMLAGDASAADVARSSLELFDRIGDLRGMAHASSALGIISARSGERDLAKRYYLEALSKSRLAGRRRDTASVLSNLGNLSQDSGEHREAWRFYDGALQLYREIGDHRGAGLILNNLSIVSQARGNHPHAVELSNEAIVEFDLVHDLQGAAASRHNLANLAVEAGDHQRALALYADAIEGFRDARDPRGVIMVLDAAADAARSCGRLGLSWKYQVDRTRVMHRLGLHGPTRQALVELAGTAQEVGQAELAERLVAAGRAVPSDIVEHALEEARHVSVADATIARAGDDEAAGRDDDPTAELTDRERELLAEVGRGKTNSEIADALFISRRTVDAHLSHIRTKLGVTDRSKLVVIAREHIVEPG